MSDYQDLNPHVERCLVVFLAVVTAIGALLTIICHTLGAPGEENWLYNPGLVFFAGLTLFWALMFIFKTVEW